MISSRWGRDRRDQLQARLLEANALTLADGVDVVTKICSDAQSGHYGSEKTFAADGLAATVAIRCDESAHDNLLGFVGVADLDNGLDLGLAQTPVVHCRLVDEAQGG